MPRSSRVGSVITNALSLEISFVRLIVVELFRREPLSVAW